MKIGVGVATFGDRDRWGALAAVALASVDNQTRPADDVAWDHDVDLRSARNAVVAALDTEWIVLLDADDELEPGYLQAMAAAVEGRSGDNLLVQPETRFVVRGQPAPAGFIPRRPSLLEANWMVIGTMFRKDAFEAVSGFDEYPIYEDWALWLKLHLELGAECTQAPGAVYRVHVAADGRNSQARDQQVEWYHTIHNRFASRTP